MKKWLMPSFAVFVLLAAAEFAIHVLALGGLYQQTAFLWRSHEQIRWMGWLMWLSYAITAPILVLIYHYGYEPSKGALFQGVRFGILMGLFLSAPMALNCYAVMPIPAALACGWFIGGMAEMVLVGAVLGLLYRG
jgi:hypothetical protein